MNFQRDPVVIVGAGPVGLTLAWRLSQAGMRVKVFEAEAEIPQQLRASTFHPPTLDMFDASGITDALISQGRITPTWQVRMLETGDRAEFNLGVLRDDTAHPYRLQCPQAELSRTLLARLPDDCVTFSAPVSSVDQDHDGAFVTVNQRRHRGAVIVGCDGARSIVRRAMGVAFDGETYPENTVLVTSGFAFEDHIQGLSGVNYIWKAGGTFSLLRLPDLWRISLHPAAGQSIENALQDDAIRAQIQAVVPEAASIDIVEKRIYRVHRRVATCYQNGALFVAGDAAHLNSPKGGMGMNGGIHDAWDLANRLIAVANGEPTRHLEGYDRTRRPIARDDILQQADQNRARMNVTDPSARLEQLRKLQAIADNCEKARTFLLRSSMIEGLRRAQTLA
ncbi:MAG: FAD-dependent oxidoreductase [Sedimentitalea sp.]